MGAQELELAVIFFHIHRSSWDGCEETLITTQPPIFSQVLLAAIGCTKAASGQLPIKMILPLPCPATAGLTKHLSSVKPRNPKPYIP